MAKKRKAEALKVKEIIKQPHHSSSEDDDVEEDQSSSSEEEETSEEKTSSEEEEESSSEESSESSSSSSEDDRNEDESSKREKLRKLLEPFGKDQLIEILKETALKDPNVLSRVTQVAESDPTHRKIFVHGLCWDATSDQVRQAFEPSGEIEECRLIVDKVTGRAKGYAFVLFKNRTGAKKALKNPQKMIGNRTVSCQLASVGPSGGGGSGDTSNRKLFVANVGQNVSLEKLRAFFGKFGEVEEGPMGFDPVTNKPRGFAIFVYKSEDGLKKALEEPVKLFEGCQLNCKKFVEGLNSNSSNSKNNVNNNANYQQQADVSYGFSVNPGVFAPNLSAGGLVMLQNPGIGLVGNPMMASALDQAGYATSGVSPVMGGMAGNYGINSISPNVIGSYGAQAALQGLGAYQSAQVQKPSTAGPLAGAAVGTAATKAQSGVVSEGMAFVSYSGH